LSNLRVGDEYFGYYVDYDHFLSKTLPFLKGLSSVDTKIVLSDLVDEEYNIFNHRNAGISRPLSSVAMHPAEDFTTNSLTQQAIQSYIDFDIKEFFGLNLIEFLNQTHDVIDMMIEVSQRKIAKKRNEMEEIQKNLAANQP
jgi:hypothetical protein